MPSTHTAFLLTSEWLDTDTEHALHFYGKSKELGPVHIIIDNSKPVFFIDRDQKLPALDVPFDRKSVGLKTLTGRPVDAVYFEKQRDLRAAADRFKATGVRHFEPEVRPAERYLMERFIQAGVEIEGEPVEENGLQVFRNPKLKPAMVVPELEVASIDIETGVTVDMLFSIAVHQTGPSGEKKKVYMLADRYEERPEDCTYYASQKELLEAFFKEFREWDPDIMIGWHVIGFDLMYLERKCAAFNVPFAFARGEGEVSLVDRPGAGAYASISGRVVVDGPPNMRAAGFRFKNFKLETVAQSILQTGKLIASDNNKVAEIERQFREDKAALARYNLEDCVLVTEIYEKVGLIDFVLKRAAASGLLPDTSLIAKAAFDFQYLPRLHRRGYVAPRESDEREKNKGEANRAFIAKPGVYQDVIAVDLGDLAFSMMRNFHIDPLARLTAGEAVVQTPDGQRFSREHHVLPEVMKRLMDWSQVARGKQDAQMVKACRVTQKAMLDAMATKGSRFYQPEIAEALTACSNWFNEQCAAFLKEKGVGLLFADRDLMLLQVPEGGDLQEQGRSWVQQISDFATQQLKRAFQIDAQLVLSFEYGYQRLVLVSGEGEERRFAGLRVAGDQPSLEIEGMPLTGSEWTALARNFQQELYQKFLSEEDIGAYLKELAADLRGGGLDEQLVYRKKLTKDLDSYTKNVPPHVKAARMLDHHPGRYIDYVFTKRGPVPAAHKPNDYDYELYINKQIEPIANPLLGLMSLSFQELTEPTQMGLF
ncbi:DNA polymerase II [Acanthopleuribacter pedis]|uniref:DNA-directed DNA polymerase n=1 Tax=Acanthopleuribacter pedis TaxID=442870 RepID=A0A8J7QF85_9BACT|nr:DNA polymerase II [Acanthopleuribacter pedis]MBO1317618.1 DNA polymerase II [Acanthopleuribacter pedis]